MPRANKPAAKAVPGARKNRGGRPPEHTPTDETRSLVMAYAMVGVDQPAIARRVGISRSSLQRHYRHELDAGMREADAEVVGSLWRMATGAKGEKPNVAAAIFWCKTRLGWRETERPEGDEDKGSREFVVRFTGAPGVEVKPDGGE